MDRSPEKQRLFDLLNAGPRKLGERNELKLLANGPGAIVRLFGCLIFLIATFVGLFGGAVDLFVKATGERMEAKITDYEWTNVHSDDETYIRVFFSYVANGVEHRSYNYTTREPSVGSERQGQFSKIRPQLAVMDGYQYGIFGLTGFIIFICILSIMGIFGVLGFSKTLTWRKLLCQGVPQWAMLTDKTTTGTEINEQPVYKLTFAFDVDGQTHQVEVKTHQKELLAELEDEEEELMVYLPGHPEKAVIWDQIPIKLDLRDDQTFATPQSIGGTWTMLLLTYGPLLYGLVRLVNIFKG